MSYIPTASLPNSGSGEAGHTLFWLTNYKAPDRLAWLPLIVSNSDVSLCDAPCEAPCVCLCAVLPVRIRMRRKAVKALVMHTKDSVRHLKDDDDEMLRGQI